MLVKLNHFPQRWGEHKKYLSCHHLDPMVYEIIPNLKNVNLAAKIQPAETSLRSLRATLAVESL